MAWTVLSSKEIYRNRWLWLTEDVVTTDSGREATYAVVHKLPYALIVPWHGDRFTLVGQYRYQANIYSWEFPQGYFEHSSIEETAKRELKEETGLSAEKIEQIGFLYPTPGATDQSCHLFLATGLTTGETELEETEEGLIVKQATLAEIHAMIRSGEIKDGTTIAALTLLAMEKYQ